MESTGDALRINKTFSIGNNYNEQEQQQKCVKIVSVGDPLGSTFFGDPLESKFLFVFIVLDVKELDCLRLVVQSLK